MALLNTTVLTYFGDMTYGDGHGGIWDTTVGTQGYSQTTSGWSGVVLPSAKKIEKVILKSGDLGYDASYSTTSITLKLYASNSMPSGPTNGTLLSTLTFTDVNAITDKELVSTDQATAYTHVWVTISTGIWSIFRGAALYEVDAPEGNMTIIDISSSGEVVLGRACNDRTPLEFAAVEIPKLRVGFKLNETRVVKFDFHGDFVLSAKSHNGTQDYLLGAGIGCQIFVRTAATLEGLATASWQAQTNAGGGGNIVDIEAHYLNKSLTYAMELPAGFYQATIMATNHTSSLPVTPPNYPEQKGVATILAEGSTAPYAGRNFFRIAVTPTGTTYHNLTT